jgi:hypothetical protein
VLLSSSYLLSDIEALAWEEARSILTVTINPWSENW